MGGMSPPLGQTWQAAGSVLPWGLKVLGGQGRAAVVLGQ